MSNKIGRIYVAVRGDDTQFKKDLTAMRSYAAKAGKDVSEALNSGITAGRATYGIREISTNLTQLAQTAKISEKQIKQTASAISEDMKDVAKSVGMTEKEYAKLNEKMLRNQATKQ